MLQSFGLRFKPWTDFAEFLRPEMTKQSGARLSGLAFLLLPNTPLNGDCIERTVKARPQALEKMQVRSLPTFVSVAERIGIASAAGQTP
jgi:hypothetical protein